MTDIRFTKMNKLFFEMIKSYLVKLNIQQYIDTAWNFITIN